MQNQTNSIGASLSTMLSGFAQAVPNIIGFLLTLIIGWIVAALVAGAVASLLRAVKFNELAQRSGFSGFVQKAGIKNDAAGVIATVAKWFIRLIVLVVAFDALGLPAVSQVLQDLLLFLPNFIVALVVLVVAGLAANALAGLVKGATAQAGLGIPDLLANIARIAVWGFGIIVAVNQLGIAATLVNTLFIGLVGALALAAGLAFGLGGRDAAAQLLQNWTEQSRAAKPKLEQAAQSAKSQSGAK